MPSSRHGNPMPNRRRSRPASRSSVTWCAAVARRRSIGCSAAGSRTWRSARCSRARPTRWPHGCRRSSYPRESRRVRSSIRTAGSSISRPCSPRPKISSRGAARSRAGVRERSTISRTRCCFRVDWGGLPLPPDPELHLLFDRLPIGMYRSRSDGVFTYVNDSLAKLLGYSVEELLTKNLNEEIHVDPTARRKLIENYFPARVVDGAEVEWRAKDGRILTVQIWGHAVESADGWSFDASVLDVSEVKRQRVELERTANILDLVVHQMPALYWVVDKDLRIIRTGGAIREVLGYESDKFMGVKLS